MIMRDPLTSIQHSAAGGRQPNAASSVNINLLNVNDSRNVTSMLH